MQSRAREADALLRAGLQRLKARGIADLEARAVRMNVAEATDPAFGAAWALRERIDRPRAFARLREPALDEDCRIAGCGRSGRSILWGE